ncbi:nuclease-related domain-containing protein [Flammeovirgaceae bacterium SG7u.111]|nr:nuclease-related domain-containing protein [Flammeovirgaceae bacterium SG7u.132]WPO33602.1 nuclease-related domain-containing protein [Flammeovirgaceae bacterium SG7u.111]
MDLQEKSLNLKKLVSKYDSAWLLGHLSELIRNISSGKAAEPISKLTSPMRQLHYLCGLNISSKKVTNGDTHIDDKEWIQIVDLLCEIEFDYLKIFFPESIEEITDEWKRVRDVSMPSFLAYFNEGTLNYEEQTQNWITDLYSKVDIIINKELGLSTNDLLEFHNNLYLYTQNNIQAILPHGEKQSKPDWELHSRVKITPSDNMPEEMMDTFKAMKFMAIYFQDYGIIKRFYPKDIISENLNEEKVNLILSILASERKESTFIYYTSENPLYKQPIFCIENGSYQLLDSNTLINAIDKVLEKACSGNEKHKSQLIDKKGKLLEKRIINLLKKFFKKDYEYYSNYYVNGYEQDILFLWKKYAFIIEAKGYNMREPFRDPNRAFTKIKDDFNSSIGKGYKQTKRIEEYFIEKKKLVITDKNNNITKEIDTSKYELDFSIIVNLKSFGQVQNDLNTLLDIGDDDTFPWVVKLDDLEVFLLTLLAKKFKPKKFIDFLLMRENLHGKLICSDELEVCGGFLKDKITFNKSLNNKTVITLPDLTDIFDEQYHKGMGLENERFFNEKKDDSSTFFM